MAFLFDTFSACVSDKVKPCFVPNDACSRTPKYRFNLRCNATLLCFIMLTSDGIVAEVFSVRLAPVRRDVQSAEKCLGVRCRSAGNLYSAVQRQRKSKCRGHSGHEGRKNLNVKSLSEALLCKKMETKKKNWHKIGMKVTIVL